MIATNAKWSAWGSACVPIAQTIGVRAVPIPAAIPRTSEPLTRRARSAVTPAPTATRIADRMLIRSAGSPNGWSRTDASQPIRT